MRLILLISLAGVLGTLSRYAVVKLLAPASGSFPYAILCVNILGSFLAGFFYIMLRERFPNLVEYLPVIFIGFLGAFTTFSTFALDCACFIHRADYIRAAVCFLANNVAGIGAAFLGLILALRLWGKN